MACSNPRLNNLDGVPRAGGRMFSAAPLCTPGLVIPVRTRASTSSEFRLLHDLACSCVDRPKCQQRCCLEVMLASHSLPKAKPRDRGQAFKYDDKFLSRRKMGGLMLQMNNTSLKHGWRRMKLLILTFIVIELSFMLFRIPCCEGLESENSL